MWDWKILTSRVSIIQQGSSRKPLTAFSLFLIQHVLDDLIPLVQAFIELGAEPQNITVVGIPYSSRKMAGDAIRSLGCKVLLPTIFPFDAAMTTSLNEALQDCRSSGKKLIILEDGGYAVPAISQMADSGQIDLAHIAGAVEQTSRGTRMDNQLAALKQLRLPVISIPDCNSKKEIEPPYIAEAVDRNLTSALNDLGATSINVVGMFGYGVIGRRVASHFRGRGADVFIADTSPDRAYEAGLRGEFKTLRPETVSTCDLLLGNTGRTSIGLLQLLSAKHGAILASSSSRQIEIDVEFLREHASVSDCGQLGPCAMPIPLFRRYTYRDASRSITLLYDGYPINFSGRSLPDHVGDAILSLLLEGVVQIPRMTSDPLVYPGNQVLKDPDYEISVSWRQCKPDDGIDPWKG